MENPIDHITKSAESVRLTSEAKGRIRAHLVPHIQQHPVALRSPYQSFFIRSPFMSLIRKPVVALMLFILVMVGGAPTYAAAGSLPGEPLYVVKVKVLEPAESLLAVTLEAKASLTVSITERRVKEVEQLAEKNKLSSKQGAESRDEFDRALERAEAKLELLRDKNPEVATKLETALTASLDAHEVTLHGFSESASSTNANEAGAFAKHVKDRVRGTERAASVRESEKGSESEHTDRGAAISATSTATETDDGSAVRVPEEDSGSGIWHRLGL